ncbi:hypothetical protein TRSC58_01276 [Trypanosoma rangeli SC58]|uniref:Uncharacterized protein n=1 Tax=Trypanosoma rangeli SC58 TaxID=429131 RepID=A0A061J6D7_TRYRA|nr:hypothetical protein TRSC58_01276 [Trypanosoma rangeli SC58]
MPPRQITRAIKRGVRVIADVVNVAGDDDALMGGDEQYDENEEETPASLGRTPASSQSRSARMAKSVTLSPPLSGALPVLREASCSSRKRSRCSGSQDAEEEEEPQELQTRDTIADSRRSGASNTSRARPSGKMLHEGEGFFHDLSAMEPLRVRLGVCPLPGNATTATTSLPASHTVTEPETSTTLLLLEARKFLTLPEEKGGADVVGWAAAFSSVAVELPAEGVYNNASVSVTVVLAP